MIEESNKFFKWTISRKHELFFTFNGSPKPCIQGSFLYSRIFLVFKDLSCIQGNIFHFKKENRMNPSLQKNPNCYDIHGSSETIRKTTFFSFDTFSPPSHIKKIDHSFLEWFIGFVEGDGSFIVSEKTEKSPLRLFFILTQKDIQVLHMIRTTLGFGRVSKHGDYFRYIVADQSSLKRLIHLFNGNLVLEKTQNRFCRLGKQSESTWVQ